MKELISISEKDGQQIVSARELHEFLNVSERFSRFMERNLGFGFEKGQDYTPYQMVHPRNLQEITDYALTIDTAKEISMLQRSEKGKQARQYFIDCEKKLRSPLKLPSTKELALMVVQAEEEKERLLIENTLKDEVIQEQAPKVSYFNDVLQSKSTYTTNQIAKEFGTSARSLNATLRGMGVQYKQNGTWLLYQKHQNKGYTKTKTYIYTGTNGEDRTSMQTVWTERGRLFIHELMEKQNAA